MAATKRPHVTWWTVRESIRTPIEESDVEELEHDSGGVSISFRLMLEALPYFRMLILAYVQSRGS